MANRALGVAVGLVCLLGPSQSQAQGEGALSRTTRGWSWTRGKIDVPLRDRSCRWTRKEAEKMAQAFDKLPDVLLRRAARFKMRWYRDAVATGRRNKKKPDKWATTVVEDGYISVGSNMMKEKARRVYRTVTHELGHVAQYEMTGLSAKLARPLVKTIGTPGFTSISWTLAATDGLKTYNGFVSEYARSDDREDFAESVEFYWINPAALKQVNEKKYRFMRDEVFKGVRSPRSSRDLEHEPIKPQKPKIRRLNKSKAKAWALVKVYGDRFMGPIDGGYNKVYFRGKRALHLPVSRSTIWAWVPTLKKGSAPVKVKTQDGRSNEQSFRVSKPWWKIW